MADTGLPPHMQAQIQPQLDRAEKLKVAWRVIICTGIAVLIVLAGLILIRLDNVTTAIRSQQVENAPKVDNTLKAAKNSKAILQYIQDCQTPGTDCYKRTQANQTDILARVADIILYAQVCTHGHLTEHGVVAAHRCIAELEGGATHVPSP